MIRRHRSNSQRVIPRALAVSVIGVHGSHFYEKRVMSLARDSIHVGDWPEEAKGRWTGTGRIARVYHLDDARDLVRAGIDASPTWCGSKRSKGEANTVQ